MRPCGLTKLRLIAAIQFVFRSGFGSWSDGPRPQSFHKLPQLFVPTVQMWPYWQRRRQFKVRFKRYRQKSLQKRWVVLAQQFSGN